MIVELLKLYEGDRHRYVIKIVALIEANAIKKLERSIGITSKQLRMLDGYIHRIKAAKTLTENEDDALDLIVLIEKVEEMGLTRIFGYKDEQKFIKQQK